MQVQPTHVVIQGKSVFTCVRMDDFLVALAEKVRPALHVTICPLAAVQTSSPVSCQLLNLLTARVQMQCLGCH